MLLSTIAASVLQLLRATTGTTWVSRVVGACAQWHCFLLQFDQRRGVVDVAVRRTDRQSSSVASMDHLMGSHEAARRAAVLAHAKALDECLNEYWSAQPKDKTDVYAAADVTALQSWSPGQV